MTEPKNFLSRWSRQKLDRLRQPDASPRVEKLATESRDPGAAGPQNGPDQAGAAPVPFDPATLPPVESIDATTDILPFLQAGVPLALKRAALRRAWSADPAIRDFIGLAENSWDFNDPNGVPGFGPLSAADLQQLADHIRAESSPFQQAESEKSTAASSSAAAEHPAAVPQRNAADAANRVAADRPENESDCDRKPDINSAGHEPTYVAMRQNGRDANAAAPASRHGGALPK